MEKSPEKGNEKGRGMEGTVMGKSGSDYRFLRVIGEGAFSRVYLAEDGKGRRYACKVSREVKMLEREAEILRGLYHPLFPAYIDYEEREETGRLVMEYISGRNLGRMIRLRGGFSPRQAMRIAVELADGLRYLHERQPAVLYRDLKPDNIMVCENGHIKVVDFGCACYLDTRGREQAGTPGFAPPEQLTEEGMAGIYSDVYGLGMTMRSVMAEKRTGHREGQIFRMEAGKGQKHCSRGGRRRIEDRKYSLRLKRMIEEAVREDFRQRPQDMISVLHILAGKGKKEEEVICEKNIWESSYKNSCSLPSI